MPGKIEIPSSSISMHAPIRADIEKSTTIESNRRSDET